MPAMLESFKRRTRVDVVMRYAHPPSVMIASVILIASLQQAAIANSKLPFHEYTVDAGHSIVEFSIGFAFTHVKGRFPQWQGTILYDSINPANSSIMAVLDAKSLDTGWPHRDSHLRTSDFFDVEHFPTITFHSEHLRPVGNSWVAEGPLTMHGVTRTVALPFHYLTPTPTRSPESRNMMLYVQGSVRLARADFGLIGGSTYNSWFTRARAATVADSVDISFEVESWRADAATVRPPQIDAAVQRITAGGVPAQVERARDLRAKNDSSQWRNILRAQDFVVRALVEAGRASEAVALSRGLVDLFPNYSNAYLTFGFATDLSGDRKGALQAYARAKELYVPPKRDPKELFPQVDDNWYYLDGLVRTLLETGRIPEAVDLANVTAELYADVPRAHSRLGEALALAGQRAQAEREFAKALQLDPTETRALAYQHTLLR
jgi:polyisoprenoid-binding protein YceI